MRCSVASSTDGSMIPSPSRNIQWRYIRSKSPVSFQSSSFVHSPARAALSTCAGFHVNEGSRAERTRCATTLVTLPGWSDCVANWR